MPLKYRKGLFLYPKFEFGFATSICRCVCLYKLLQIEKKVYIFLEYQHYLNIFTHIGV